MTLEKIKEIAETWFEWPTERRETFTYTSALLFARDMYERGQTAERERITGGRMTLEKFIEQHVGFPTYEETWKAAQVAERERIRSRVKAAAESVWGIRDFIDKRYGLYVGPPLNTLEQFIEKLLDKE